MSEEGGRYRDRYFPSVDFSSIAVGDRLPAEDQLIDHTRVVMSAAATATFFRGHIDSDYAATQRRRGVYLATGAINGLVDAYVGRWAGPRAFLRKRSVSIRDSVCAGDRITTTAEVIAIEPAAETDIPPGSGTRGSVTLDVTVTNQLETPCVRARVTLLVPGPVGGAA